MAILRRAEPLRFDLGHSKAKVVVGLSGLQPADRIQALHDLRRASRGTGKLGLHLSLVLLVAKHINARLFTVRREVLHHTAALHTFSAFPFRLVCFFTFLHSQLSMKAPAFDFHEVRLQHNLNNEKYVY